VTNAARAEALVRALRAGRDGDLETVRTLVTDDVRAWTPVISTGTVDELIDALGDRNDTFSDADLRTTPHDVGGDFACVEWVVEVTHTGPLAIGPQSVIEPTGARVAIHGITVAEFHGTRICSIRQYWDENEVLGQIGVLGP
jgi:ketosteroid isomerase-like protein